MHTYRTKEFKEDFEEIEESDEDIIKDSGSDSEDCESDDHIQEFPTRESEIEETKELGSYKTEDKIIYESRVLFLALKTVITMVEINGQEAVVLLDLGCTMDAISPQMVQIVGLKVHQLTEQIPIQLGTKGSKSQINHGMKACIKFGTVEMNHYFDIINIDRYDVIIGMYS